MNIPKPSSTSMLVPVVIITTSLATIALAVIRLNDNSAQPSVQTWSPQSSLPGTNIMVLTNVTHVKAGDVIIMNLPAETWAVITNAYKNHLSQDTIRFYVR